MKATLIVTALMTAGLALAPAQAANHAQPVTQITVRHADLDLANPAGAGAMLRRLEAAANQACGGRPDLRLIYAQRFFHRCVETALDDAVAQLDAPLVTALHVGEPPRFAGRQSD